MARLKPIVCEAFVGARSAAVSAAGSAEASPRPHEDGIRHLLGAVLHRDERAEQQAAIGDVDVLFLPVGGGPTIGGEASAQVVELLSPRLAIPMHYRTDAINFLDSPDAFLDTVGLPVRRPETNELVVNRSSLGDASVALLSPPARLTPG